jgi:hypothetical protein
MIPAPGNHPVRVSSDTLVRRFWWAAVLPLLMILAVELFVPAYQQSQTPDEADHMLGGVRYWKYGDFGTNPEHPPLAKLVAALPILDIPCPPAVAFTQFFKMENFGNGIAFLYTHDADSMLWRARLAISVFTFILALLVLAAGYEMFGLTTGLVALLIFVLEPNLLAHGAMVTTDMAEACCFFAAIYAFYRWRRNPTIWRLMVCGIASAEAREVQGNILLAMHRTDDARRSFKESLSLAHADFPEFQLSRILKIPPVPSEGVK